MNVAHPSHKKDGRSILFLAIANSARPRKRMTVSQWADGYRMLSSKGSSEPGPWKTARTPYLREIMDCLSVHSPVQRVVVIKAAQLGLTAAALNWIGYIICENPASVLVVIPTDKLLEEWVAQDLNPMLTESPVVNEIVSSRPRDASNRKDLREFPGGLLMLMGANSENNFRQKKAKYLIADDIDAYPQEVGDEGDPIGLLARRQATFARRKALLISTPTIKDASRIDEEYERSDKRRFYVPCPHCNKSILLRWANLLYTKNPQTGLVTGATYLCEECGKEIHEHCKTEMLALGRWIPEHPDRPTRGYHINGLYAPIGLGYRWVELAQEWIDAQGDYGKLKRFMNTVLGEVWEDRTHDVKANVIMERAEPYALREIPIGCFILTCGVDVQGDRLEAHVLGFGRDVIWTIDYIVIPGDPAREDVWASLVTYLNRPFTNSCGKEMFIQAAAIDTGGHHTHDVYNFARSRSARRLMAIKGSNIPNKPVLSSRPASQDVNWRGKVIKGGVKLWMVGTDTVKHMLFNRLLGDANVDAGARKVRFSAALTSEFYDGLTSEVFDPEKSRWTKRRGRRNEPLDTWGYAVAASQHPEIRVHALRASDWARLEQMLEPPTVESPPPPPPEPTGPVHRPNQAVRSGFVNRWKNRL
jgi:phage terminase large subunit GpA-like protein